MGPCKSGAAVMIRFLGALSLSPPRPPPPPPPPPPRPVAAAAPDQKLKLCVQTRGKETPARLPQPPYTSFLLGRKKNGFGKQTTNYKLQGSCFILHTKRTALHGRLLNEGIFAELMQKK